jgi:hypothetical protein
VPETTTQLTLPAASAIVPSQRNTLCLADIGSFRGPGY